MTQGTEDLGKQTPPDAGESGREVCRQPVSAPTVRHSVRLAVAFVLCLTFWFCAPPPPVDSQGRSDSQGRVGGEASVAGIVERAPSILPQTGATVSPPTPSQAGNSSPADVTGRWLLNEGIRRDVTMFPDGTATMEIQLDFFASLLYGSQMSLRLNWSLKEGILTHTIVDGTPKNNVDRLIRDFGGTRSYKVLRLDRAVLELEDSDPDRTVYRWQRGS